jgi:hypothetical protein
MKKAILALFLALLAILIMSPRWLYNIYDNTLGKLILIIVIIFLTRHNTTLGLLAVLCVIVVLHEYMPFVEGMDNNDNIQTPGTIGEDNIPAPTGPNVQNIITKEEAKKKLSDLKEKANEAGIDLNDIKDAISSKDSNSIPVDKQTMTSSENVQPFSPNMLKEGFCGACAIALA